MEASQICGFNWSGVQSPGQRFTHNHKRLYVRLYNLCFLFFVGHGLNLTCFARWLTKSLRNGWTVFNVLINSPGASCLNVGQYFIVDKPE